MKKPKLWKVKRKITIWEETNIIADTRADALEMINYETVNWKETTKDTDLCLTYFSIINRNALEL